MIETPRTLISTPIHDFVHPEFKRSLGRTLQISRRIKYDELVGISHVEFARATLVGRFLLSDYEVMLCIDGDMSWQTKDIEAVLEPIAAGKAHVVAGLYMTKNEPITPTFEFLSHDVDKETGYVGPTLEINGHGYFRIAVAGAGFFAMTRHAIEEASKLVESYCPIGRMSVTGKLDERHPLLFRSRIHYRAHQPNIPRSFGEDYGACLTLQQAGFMVWAAREALPVHHSARGIDARNLDINQFARDQAAHG